MAEPTLREWLSTSAALSPQYLERALATLDAQEVDNVRDLRVLGSLPAFDECFTATTAAKIRNALAADHSSDVLAQSLGAQALLEDPMGLSLGAQALDRVLDAPALRATAESLLEICKVDEAARDAGRP